MGLAPCSNGFLWGRFFQMSASDLPPELLSRLEPPALDCYALATGWVPVPNVPWQSHVYHHPGDREMALWVPRRPHDHSFTRMMADAVVRLAAVDGRPPRELLHDLLLHDCDVLRFRVGSASPDYGTLSLGEGTRLLDGVRRALAAAACAAVRPGPAHDPEHPAVRQFLAGCLLGPTEHGSLTFPVACRLPAAPDVPAEEAPFPRQVIGLFLRSAASVAEARATRNGAKELLPLAGDARLSAELCEALAEMHGQGERDGLTISVSWSAAWPLAEEGRLPREVSLRPEAFAPLADLGRWLREVAEPQDERLAGTAAGQ